MRRIKEQEIPQLCHFMIEQFYEREELQRMFHDVNQETAKNIAEKLMYHDLCYFYKYGDIFVYDNTITSAVVGIQSKKMSFLKRIPFAIRENLALRELSKEDLHTIKKNSKLISKVHSTKWFKNYCKNPYYLAQFAVDKNKRGQGIAREMLEELFQYASSNCDIMALETLTEAYVPMYEHFRFKCVEEYETKSKELTEYRMLKRIK